MHAVLLTQQKPNSYMKNPNELSAASSLRGDELQLIEQKASIVVGIANSRTRLRIGILLSKYSEYQVVWLLRIHSASIITIGLEGRLMVSEMNLSH